MRYHLNTIDDTRPIHYLRISDVVHAYMRGHELTNLAQAQKAE